MKRIVVILSLIISFTSCKKDNTQPAPVNSNTNSTNTPPTSTINPLPDNYIILHDGNNTDTLSCTDSSPWVNSVADSNLTHYFTAPINNHSYQVKMFFKLPTDSIRLSSFPIGKYRTDTVSSFGFISSTNLNLGSIGFRRTYNMGEFISSGTESTASYFNNITSIVRLKTKYNTYTQTNCALYTITGEFSINCKSNTSTENKSYTGSYRLTFWSNNKFW